MPVKWIQTKELKYHFIITNSVICFHLFTSTGSWGNFNYQFGFLYFCFNYRTQQLSNIHQAICPFSFIAWITFVYQDWVATRFTQAISPHIMSKVSSMFRWAGQWADNEPDNERPCPACFTPTPNLVSTLLTHECCQKEAIQRTKLKIAGHAELLFYRYAPHPLWGKVGFTRRLWDHRLVDQSPANLTYPLHAPANIYEYFHWREQRTWALIQTVDKEDAKWYTMMYWREMTIRMKMTRWQITIKLNLKSHTALFLVIAIPLYDIFRHAS